MHPAEQAVLGEDVGVAHGVAGAVLHMLIDVVADHQVRCGAAGHQGGQLCQHLLQGIGVQPVVTVHHLVVQAGGVADALVDALAVAAVLLMDGLDDGGVLGGIFVADGRGLVLDGTVVHQNDLGLLACGQQRFDAVAHVGCRVVAGDRKGDKFLHNKRCSFFFESGTASAGMERCSLIIAFSRLKSYRLQKLTVAFRAFCRKSACFPAQKAAFVVYWYSLEGTAHLL